MKEEVNECSEQISEKCNELFNIQATLASCKENHKHEIESYETEMEKVEEDTRSLKVKLEKIQEENDELVGKKSKLCSQIELLKKDEKQNKLLMKENLRELQSKDKIIDELHKKREEDTIVISRLKEQAIRLC